MNKLVNREDNTAPATDFLQLLVDLATKASAAHRHQHMRKAAIGLEVKRLSSARMTLTLRHQKAVVEQLAGFHPAQDIAFVTDHQVYVPPLKLICDQVRA